MFVAPAFVDPRTRKSWNFEEGEDILMECEAKGMPSKILLPGRIFFIVKFAIHLKNVGFYLFFLLFLPLYLLFGFSYDVFKP